MADDPTPQELSAAFGWTPIADENAEPDDAESTPITAQAAPTAPPAAAPAVVAAPAPVAVAPDNQAVMQRESQAAQMRANVLQAGLQYRKALIDGGMDPEEAHLQAETAAAQYYAQYQQGVAQYTAQQQAKQDLMGKLSKEHGVPAEMLEGFNDAKSMTAAAKLWGGQQKEIADIKGKVTPKAPVQQFDSGGGSNAGSRASQQLAYVSGKGPAMTAAQFEQVFGYNPL